MTTQLPISLVVITYNEESNLARCLAAADFCAELVIIDSGSTDSTVKIAKQLGARIIEREWTGYRDQKNFGTSQAMQQWVLCIDADEVVSPKLRASIHEAFATQPAADAFEINRHSYYAGKLINHSGWYPQWRLFLYRKDAAEWGGAEPHTTVVFKGKLKVRLRGDLFHYTYDGIRHHMSKLVTQAHDSAAAMRAANRGCSWIDLLLRPPWAVFKAYVLERGFLDGFYGLVISVSAGYYTFLKYAMLRELNGNARA